MADLQKNGAAHTQWNGLPVIVLLRSKPAMALLESPPAALRDPDSERSVQPEQARNPWRSARPEVFVAIALGTDLRCPVQARTEAGLLLGFIDQCRGWRYDAAGRVFDGQGALRNLRIPPYHIDNDRIVIGAQ